MEKHEEVKYNGVKSVLRRICEIHRSFIELMETVSDKS